MQVFNTSFTNQKRDFVFHPEQRSNRIFSFVKDCDLIIVDKERQDHEIVYKLIEGEKVCEIGYTDTLKFSTKTLENSRKDKFDIALLNKEVDVFLENGLKRYQIFLRFKSNLFNEIAENYIRAVTFDENGSVIRDSQKELDIPSEWGPLFNLYSHRNYFLVSNSQGRKNIYFIYHYFQGKWVELWRTENYINYGKLCSLSFPYLIFEVTDNHYNYVTSPILYTKECLELLSIYLENNLENDFCKDCLFDERFYQDEFNFIDGVNFISLLIQKNFLKKELSQNNHSISSKNESIKVRFADLEKMYELKKLEKMNLDLINSMLENADENQLLDLSPMGIDHSTFENICKNKYINFSSLFFSEAFFCPNTFDQVKDFSESLVSRVILKLSETGDLAQYDVFRIIEELFFN